MAIVSVYARLFGYLDEIPVDVPKVDSDTPIIIRLCPEFELGKRSKFYLEHGNIYFSKEKAINCTPGGGGGGGGG